MSFKNFFKETAPQRVDFQLSDGLVSFYTKDNDLQKLIESSKHFELSAGYDLRTDTPHGQGQYHLHLFHKGNEIMAMNYDGSSHDGNSGCRLPKTVADFIKEKLPRVRIPQDRYIECIRVAEINKLLLLLG